MVTVSIRLVFALFITASTITAAIIGNDSPTINATPESSFENVGDIRSEIKETLFFNRMRKADEEVGKGNEKLDNERPRYMKQGRPLFEVLLISICVNFFTLAAMLFFIPFLNNTNRWRWHWANSLFWIPTRLIFEKNLVASGDDDSEDDQDHPELERQNKRKQLMDIFVPSFACGATLSTTFFLIIPESLLLIQEALKSYSISDGGASHERYSRVVARFGVMVLAGFTLPQFLYGVFPRLYELNGKNKSDFKVIHSDNVDQDAAQVGTPAEEEKMEEQVDDVVKFTSTNENKLDLAISTTASEEGSMESIIPYRTYNILLRDAVFNFLHGILLGTAFMTCSNAMSICISVIVLFQRISQEATTYVLLTKYVGLWFSNALLFNVWTGLSCIGGSMVILGGGFYDDCIGMVLAFGGGFFLHTVSDIYLKRIYSIVRIGMKDRMLAIFFFAIGAVVVGVTLNAPRRCAQVRITSEIS